MIELPEYLDIETRRNMMQHYEAFKSIFGQVLLDKHLSKAPISHLADIRLVEASMPPRPLGPEVFLGSDMNYITDHLYANGRDWTSTSRVLCHHYLTPLGAQGSYIARSVIRPCVLDKWTFLKKFKIAVYAKPDEIYVHLENPVQGHYALYVPYAALVNKDFSLIEERMDSYFNWYTNGRLGWGDFKSDPVVELLSTYLNM